MEKRKVVISKTLKDLGVSCNILGYGYLREAIYMYMNDDSVIHSGITKQLYPEVATKFNTTPSRVERAMRHGVEKVFDNGDWKLIEEIFANTISANKGKATNAQFIAGVAEYLLLQEEVD